MMPVLAIDAQATEHVLHRQGIEAHRCGMLVDARSSQVQEVASAKSQE